MNAPDRRRAAEALRTVPTPSAMLLGFFLLASAAVVGAGPVAAQTPPQIISPLSLEPDHNGVNITTGRITFRGPELSIPAAPRLRFDYIQNAAPYFLDSSSGSGDTARQDGVSVHYGGETSESFHCQDYDCTSVNGYGAVTGTGSTLLLTAQGQTAIYQRAPSGEVYHFTNKASHSCGPNSCQNLAYVSSVAFPDGEAITYSYDTVQDNGYTYYRPNKIASDTGYYISITYQNSTFGSQDWASPKTATIYSAADPNTPLQQLTYNESGTITDIAGRVWTCASCLGVMGVPIETFSGSEQLPTESSPARQVGVFSSSSGISVVGSVTNDGVGWTYAYQNLSGNGPQAIYTQLSVTGPNAYSQVYTIDPGSWTVIVKPNLITQIKDSLNRITAFQYGANYQVSKITYPELNSVEVFYDLDGNIISKISHAKPGSNLADTSESAFVDTTNCLAVLCYRPIWHKDALGRETDDAYDVNGQLLEQIDPADATGVHNVTYIDYDTVGPVYRKRVVHECGLTNPPAINQAGAPPPSNPCTLSTEFHTEYDYWGSTFLPSVERRVDEATGTTLTTSYAYDPSGHLVQVTGPLAGSDKQYGYDTVGRKIWEMAPRDANGYRIARKYGYRDSDDKIATVRTGTVANSDIAAFAVTSRIDTTYDAQRNPVRDATSSGGAKYEVIDRSFDSRGRKLCETTRMNPAAFGSLPSDACTLGGQGSQGPDRITQNVYDAANQLLQVQKAYLTPLQQNYASYSYSPNGKQTSVSDADGNLANMAYDGFDRLSTWTFPSKTTAGQVNTADYEQYGYDAAGERTSLRKRDGRTLSFTYDALGRVIVKTTPPGCAPLQVGSCPPASATRTVHYGYDIRGLQLYARFDTTGGEGVTNRYDGFGRLTSSATSIGGFGGTVWSTWDADGNRTRVRHPDGAHFDSVYDAADRLRSATMTPVGGTASPILTIAYDPLGRRVTMSPASSDIDYSYDPVSRLSVQTQRFAGGVGDMADTLGYNGASQIVSQARSNDGFVWTGGVSVSRGYGVNGLNQYTAAGPARFTYDADGNLVSDGASTYAYDAENRLIAASGAASAALLYDPLGRLWQTSGGTAGVTRFLHDGDEIVAEYDGSGGLLRRYMWGPGIDEPVLEDEGGALACGAPGAPTTLVLHADHQGSVIALADCWGNRTNVNTYDEYGIPGSGNLGRFQYTGQAWIPELGMYYYKARIYSPTLGRFLQTDPIGYSAGPNLYMYVNDDPIDNTDPTGLDCNSGNGTTTCDPGVKGLPAVSFPTPKGWPSHIGPGSKDYHHYDKTVATKGGETRADQTRNGIVKAPTPGVGNKPASPTGTVNNATPGGVPPSMVKSYVVTDANGNKVVTNVTMPGHPLFPGYVERGVVTGPGTITVHNAGEGTGALQGPGSPVRDIIDNVWIGQTQSILNQNPGP